MVGRVTKTFEESTSDSLLVILVLKVEPELSESLYNESQLEPAAKIITREVSEPLKGMPRMAYGWLCVFLKP